jgi:hypothetical protein
MNKFLCVIMVLVLIGIALFVFSGGIAAVVAVARWIG